MEAVLAAVPAAFVDQPEGARELLEEFDQLRRGTSQQLGCGLGVVAAFVQDIERFGQKRGKVSVMSVHDDPAGAASLPPERAGNIRLFRIMIDRLANRQGKLE